MQALSEPAPAEIRDVLRLAWPSVLSFVCNSAYRVNDQYWIQGLGPDAQAALGASFFILILNFSFFFLSVAGSLSLVARSVGARDNATRDSVVRHSLALSTGIALLLAALGSFFLPAIVGGLGLTADPAEFASDYLGTIYLFTLPLALAPTIDNIFIGMGNTRTPLLLTSIAVTTNFALNPCLIYGLGPFEAHGMAGAAMATGISRSIASVLGLAILRYRFGVRWGHSLRFSLRQFARILRIGLPSAISIAMYAGVYLALFQLVLSHLGRDAMAGLGIGFNAFEGVSFPFFLGVAVAGSSLVGRNLGAGHPDEALRAVRNVRRVGIALGFGFMALFFLLGPRLVPVFASDPGVVSEATRYVRILAIAQLFVAIEAVNEKILLGSGHSQPIFWISVPGNLLRIPLAWLLALHWGYGAAGVWWAINFTTFLKAGAFFLMVQRRTWLSAEVWK